MVNKSKNLIESMNDEELRILILAFSKPKVIEALKIYHTIPGYLKNAFIEPAKKKLLERGIVKGNLGFKSKNLLEFQRK